MLSTTVPQQDVEEDILLSRDEDVALPRATGCRGGRRFVLAVLFAGVLACVGFVVHQEVQTQGTHRLGVSGKPGATVQLSSSGSPSVGINGFGKLGRMVLRSAMTNPDVTVRAINVVDHAPDRMAYDFKHDSVLGEYRGTVETDGDDLVVDGQKIMTTRFRDPREIPWGANGVDYVIETTGIFTSREHCNSFLAGGAKKVVVAAPAKDMQTVVVGVNDQEYDGSENCLSAASQNANGLAPLVKAIDNEFGIKQGFVSVVEGEASEAGDDWRAGRSASSNIVPASTEAATEVSKVYPRLKGKLAGVAFHVPVVASSAIDFTCELEKETTYEEVCAKIEGYSEGPMKGILGYSDEPKVSSDFDADTRVSVFNENAGIMLDPSHVKLVTWTNEYAYANTVVALTKIMSGVDGAR